jgi:hypothetical protein
MVRPKIICSPVNLFRSHCCRAPSPDNLNLPHVCNGLPGSTGNLAHSIIVVDETARARAFYFHVVLMYLRTFAQVTSGKIWPDFK